MAVYLLHSDVILARGGTRGVNHYLGHAPDADTGLQNRVWEHVNGATNAAKICNEFRRRGATLQLVYIEPDADVQRERQLKNIGHFSERLCPICRLIEPVLDAIEGTNEWPTK
jgi:hypothetical protein